MTRQQKVNQDAQKLVRKIVTKQFGQKASDKLIRDVAKKVSAAIPQPLTA